MLTDVAMTNMGSDPITHVRCSMSHVRWRMGSPGCKARPFPLQGSYIQYMTTYIELSRTTEKAYTGLCLWVVTGVM